MEEARGNHGGNTLILRAAINAMLSEQERPPLLPKVETFADRAAKEFEEILLDLAESKLTRSPAAYETAMKRTRAYLAGILTLGNLTGRRSMLMEADKVSRKVAASVVPTVKLADYGDVPKVEFQDAINDLITREPRLASSAAEVQAIYAQQHAFALARVTDLRVTQRVQAEIAKSLREGFGVAESSANIARILGNLEGYAESYSSTVFRTNAWNAFTAGQFQQAQDPDVADMIPAFEYSAIRDGDARPNHLAADGLLAATNDPVWNRHAPPQGFACRCDLITVDFYTLQRRGRIDAAGKVIPYYPPTFSQAHPDKGFGLGRPGTGIVGVS